MRKRFSILLTAALLAGAPVTQAAEAVDGVVAVVNGEVITMTDVVNFNLYDEIAIARQFRGEELNKKLLESRRNAMRQLIENRLIYKEFVSKGYMLPREPVEERLDRMIAQRAGGDRTAFIQMLEANGRSLEDYKKEIEETVAVEMMVGQNVYQNIDIPADEVADFYENNKKQFYTPAEIELALISLPEAGQVPAILKEIEEGLTFEEAVEKYSTGSKANGGSLGRLKLQELRADFKEAVLGKTIGKPFGPVTLDGKEHIFLVREFTAGVLDPLDSVTKSKIRRMLRQPKEAEAYKKYVEKLKKRGFVETMVE